jgi:hypothetical protein
MLFHVCRRSCLNVDSVDRRLRLGTSSQDHVSTLQGRYHANDLWSDFVEASITRTTGRPTVKEQHL